jgi:hypothetical protein
VTDGDTPTVGSGIEVVRRILEHGRSKEGAKSGGVYARAANGSLPVVVQALRQVDIILPRPKIQLTAAFYRMTSPS